MGIRFFCPECRDRMNVKAFLAGKRGICPKCDARFVIPSESDPAAEQQSRAANGQKSPSTQETKASAQGNSAQRRMSEGVAATAAKNPPENREKAQTQAEPAASQTKRKQTKGRTSTDPTGGETVEAKSPTQPATSTSTTPASTTPASTTPASTTSASTTSASTVADRRSEVHPTMVDPHKVWYVRPRTGGEFGPADGPLMKRWIEEGRVAGDSLVWCEGWDDWKNAALVFAELANHSPPAIVPSSTERIVISDAHVVSHPGEPAAGAGSSHPVGTSAQQVETPAGNSEPRPGLPRRRPDLGRRAATVVVLSIVAIVLLIVLIKVVVDAT